MPTYPCALANVPLALVPWQYLEASSHSRTGIRQPLRPDPGHRLSETAQFITAYPELFPIKQHDCFPRRRFPHFCSVTKPCLLLWIIPSIFQLYGYAGARHKVASVLYVLWEQSKVVLKLNWLTIILDSIKLKHIAHILHNKPQLFHGSN